MDFYILYIGKLVLSQWTQELYSFGEARDMKIELINEDTLEGAYNHLFSGKIGLIIIDSDLEEADEFITMVKNEVVLRHISILVILPEYNIDVVKKILLNGADRVITMDKIEEGMFFPVIRPIIMSSILTSEKISRTSELQDKAITNFIMLDLIKDYIPKTIWKVAQKYAHLQKLTLPGEEREATVVFGDIKGFTKISQHLTPKEVIANLNAVYEVVTRYIYMCNGDVDKFIGDAFFGIFDFASDAVRSMVLIQKELQQLNAKRKKEGLDEINFRIGVHTGLVIRGNVGGHHRYDNTLIGDTINTASRLEHISPCGDVSISDDTRIKLELEIPADCMFTTRLRGRDCDIQYYTVYNFLKDNKDFLKV